MIRKSKAFRSLKCLTPALALLVTVPLVEPALTDAADPTAAPAEMAKRLRVGVKAAPPFVLRGEDGRWEGISVDLWRRIAEDLGVAYDLEERDIKGLIDGLDDASLDVAVAALTVTAERAERVDFSHPFYTSGLGIAVSSAGGSRAASVFARLFSWEFATAIGGLAAFMLAAGALVWLVERRRNAEQFGGTPLQGLGAGFWWSAVTMTTVGYGDKAPVTVAGRLIGLIWMFTGVITISTFTASIASVLTLSQLQGEVNGPDDLAKVRTGYAAASTSSDYIAERRLRSRPFPDVESAMKALDAGEIGAVVHDAPILRYLSAQDYEGRLAVLPMTFERQDYAFGLQHGSGLRKALNQKLLEHITAASWQQTLDLYFGN